jgi:hypothetical protein
MATKTLINYTREAFQLPINLLFLSASAIGAVVAYVLGGTNVMEPVLFSAAGLEMAYLALMPMNDRFVRAVNAKRQPDTQRLEDQLKNLNLITQLGKSQLDKYTELYKKKSQISDNLVRQSVTSGGFLDAYIGKVNNLEVYFVQLLYNIDQYEKFLQRETSDYLSSEMAKVKAEMEANTSTKVRELYQKRIDLIKKRLEKNLAVKEQLQVARIQLATLEDTINYLLEQTMTIDNPAEITRMIDSVLNETEEHHSSIQEIQGILDDTNLPFVGEIKAPSGNAAGQRN